MIREQAVPSDSAAWLGIVNNVILAVFKGGVGLLFDSRALLADALYSASDAAAGIAEKLQLPQMFKKRVGKRHGGSGNSTAEPLIACLFAVFLFMGALQLGITSISAMVSGNILAPGYMSVVAVVVSIALREIVFQIQQRQNRKHSGNTSLSYIEIHKYSLYASIIVLLGVFGAMAGEAWDIPLMLYIDPAAALIVAGLVFWRGYHLILGALYGKQESKMQIEDKTPFIETVQRVHGVITVDEMKLTDNGHYISAAVIISVNPQISVLEANHIANRAKILLMNRFSQVSDVSIQIMPYDPGYPYKSNYEGSNNNLPTLLQ
ncbi:cation diffusion facilitator family transporter [Paenibacillus lentus]|uniref:Cation diffusion facilitator family transporter n=1 Tax=Paenibacillus lentus TaxID=1338368 RepID=A0A3S8RU76_9BACL|nr:cation diffusion facilitator family transporter [Paenibacillus lentus]AZK46541.1 cation diffusion facilitator family transporter [Paenibacillus lentus]